MKGLVFLGAAYSTKFVPKSAAPPVVKAAFAPTVNQQTSSPFTPSDVRPLVTFSKVPPITDVPLSYTASFTKPPASTPPPPAKPPASTPPPSETPPASTQSPEAAASQQQQTGTSITDGGTSGGYDYAALPQDYAALPQDITAPPTATIPETIEPNVETSDLLEEGGDMTYDTPEEMIDVTGFDFLDLTRGLTNGFGGGGGGSSDKEKALAAQQATEAARREAEAKAQQLRTYLTIGGVAAAGLALYFLVLRKQ